MTVSLSHRPFAPMCLFFNSFAFSGDVQKGLPSKLCLRYIPVNFPPVQAANEGYNPAFYYNTNAIVSDSNPVVFFTALELLKVADRLNGFGLFYVHDRTFDSFLELFTV